MKLLHYDTGAKKAISIFIPNLGCPNLCVFCNQQSISGAKHLPVADEIENNVRTALKNGSNPKEFELAFFGGSFTSIDPSTMAGYLDIAKSLTQKYGLFGLRVSARPDDIDKEKLLLLQNAGITTIEIGAQSLNDRVLARSGRGHTSADVRHAAKLIKSRGIHLVLQMMTGLPGDNDEGALQTAKELLALSPDGVRIYPLLVLKGTALEQEYYIGAYQPQSLLGAVTLCSEIAAQFYHKGVPVIKLGLHASADFREGELVAGPYHEAFRELVDGKIIRDAAQRAIEKGSAVRQLTIRCSSSDVSKAIGHKKENANYFREKYGTQLKVVGGELSPGEFEFIL